MEKGEQRVNSNLRSAIGIVCKCYTKMIKINEDT